MLPPVTEFDQGNTSARTTTLPGSTSPTSRRRNWHTVATRLALASLLITVPAALLIQGTPHDLRVYQAGGDALLHGVGLYSEAFFGLTPGQHLPFIYPPMAAILFTPMAVMPFWLVTVLFSATGIAALGLTARVAARRIYGPTSTATLVAAVVTASWLLLQPVRDTLGWGQINLVLMGMVAADCLLPRTRWPRGMLLGLAAAIKLTPAVFGLYFLLRRQYKQAAVSAVSFVGFTLAGFALAPAQSAQFWTDTLFADKVGVGYFMNQGVRGLLHRLGLHGSVEVVLWLVAVAGLIAVAVFLGRRAVAAGQDVTAMLVIAVCGVLASPISWAHHWVWVVLAAVALPRVLARSRVVTRCLVVAAMTLFAVGPVWLGGVQPDWLRAFLVSPYPLVAVALLATLAARLPKPTPAAFAPRVTVPAARGSTTATCGCKVVTAGANAGTRGGNGGQVAALARDA